MTPNLAITVVRGEEGAMQLLQALAPTTVPDLVVLEVPRDAEAATARLARFRMLAPDIPIIAWLDAQDPELVLRLMESGASDCLLKRTASATTLADALGLAAARPALERTVDRVDLLTGLLSQQALIDHVGRLLDRKRRRPEFQFAVLAVDVADFYSIRQRYGRHSSEQLLVTLARRLMASARPLDAVGRLPDAEFILVLPQLEDKSDAWAVAWRLENRLTEPIRIDNEPLQIMPRWGITLSAEAFDGPHDMLGAAVLESKTF
ncbi:MAG: diguanylate cyclase [Acidobacteriota bacterium]